MSLRSEITAAERTPIVRKSTREETHAAAGCEDGQMKTPIHENRNRALMMMVTPSFCRHFESVGSCSPSCSPSMESVGSCSHSHSTESTGSFFSPIVDLEFLRAGMRDRDLRRPFGENNAATASTPPTAESFFYDGMLS